MATALVILADGFEEIEAVAPIDLLRRAGVDVTVAGLGGILAKSTRGLAVNADAAFDRLSSDFDALVLPGGAQGAKNLAASEKVGSLIKDMFKKKKWVCAICAAPAVVLFPTGILNGKSATCSPGMESKFDSSVKHSNQKVVVDGNVITSQGPATAIEFSLTIIEKLKGKAESEKIRAAVLA